MGRLAFRILGPLEVVIDGKSVALGGPKQRAVLALLLLHPNEVVSRDRIIDALWGEHPPESSRRSLDSYVSRLRSALGADRIVRRAPGYAFQVAPGELDSHQFAERVERALGDRDARPEAAVRDLRAALALWRGPALSDLSDEPALAVEASRLDGLRIHAEEELAEVQLALGHGAALVPTLERLTRQEPLRERTQAQLMHALYQAGRVPQALESFQGYRRLLAEELGLEPGPSVRNLEQRILQHDETLLPGRPSSLSRARIRPWTRSLTIAVATLILAGAAISAALLLRTSPASVTTLSSPAMIALSTTSAVGKTELDAAPASTASGAGSIWVTEPDAGEVIRIDPRTGAINDHIPIVGSPGPIAFGGGTVWVTDVLGARLLAIDPGTDRITESLTLGSLRATAIAADADTVWVADVTQNSLVEIDARSDARRRTILLGHRPSALVVTNSTVWVASYDADAVDAINRKSGETLATLHVGNGPSALAATPDAIWVANTIDSTVSRIDLASGSVVSVVSVGSAPAALTYAKGSLWVANEYGETLSRLDTTTNRVISSRQLGGAGTAVVAVAGRLWVGVRPVTSQRGGTLTMLSQRPITIDPALQLDLPPPQTDGLTRDTLVTYDHAGGLAGLQLVPDLAVTLPAPADNGTSYTFRLRPGLRYSNGQPVHAVDFRRAIERELYLGTSNHALFDSLRGIDKCQLGTHCDLSDSIVTNESTRTVTYHLTKADPTFLADALTNASSAPVPAGTSLDGVALTHIPIPGTGPYKVASATAKAIRYVRNPYFREWSHAAQPDGNPDQIVMRFGLTPTQEAHAVEHGTADWSADPIPPPLLREIERRYGTRLHSFSTTETDFFRFNTNHLPFSNLLARRALNLALDRAAIVRAYGGTAVATATCQLLPPGLTGYQPNCTNPGGLASPNLRRARQLVNASGTSGRTVQLWIFTDDSSFRLLSVIARNLRELGYRVRLHVVPHSYFDNHDPRRDGPNIDLIPIGWGDTAPDSFFTTWLTCDSPFNYAYCNPSLDQLVRHAQALATTAPRKAAATWTQADRLVVEDAALLPLVNERQLDFVSTRVHNFQHHPYWGILADQIQLR